MSESLLYRLIGFLIAIIGVVWFVTGLVASDGSSVLAAFFAGALMGGGASLLATGTSPRSWFLWRMFASTPTPD